MLNMLLIFWKNICIGTLSLKDDKIEYCIHCHGIEYARRRGLMEGIVLTPTQEFAHLPDWIEDRVPKEASTDEKFEYLRKTGGRTATDGFWFI